jgi:hypothetical protein
MVGYEQVTLTPVFFLIETADNVSPRSTEAAHRVRRSATRGRPRIVKIRPQGNTY